MWARRMVLPLSVAGDAKALHATSTWLREEVAGQLERARLAPASDATLYMYAVEVARIIDGEPEHLRLDPQGDPHRLRRERLTVPRQSWAEAVELMLEVEVVEA